MNANGFNVELNSVRPIPCSAHAIVTLIAQFSVDTLTKELLRERRSKIGITLSNTFFNESIEIGTKLWKAFNTNRDMMKNNLAKEFKPKLYFLSEFL